MRGNTNSITELSVKTGTSDKLTNVTIYMELLEKRGGVVSWNGELSSTVDIASWETLATLPQGFRPNSNFMTSLVDFGGNNLPLTVTTEGKIKTSHVLKNKNDGHYYYLSMVFMAGGGIKALLGKARALLQEVLSHAGKHQCYGDDRQYTDRRNIRDIHNAMGNHRSECRGYGWEPCVQDKVLSAEYVKERSDRYSRRKRDVLLDGRGKSFDVTKGLVA